MGYYVELHSSDWEIEDNPRSLQAIRSMPKKYHAIKRGGSSNGDKWFSWMNDSDIENAKSVESVFNKLGFETEPGTKPNTFRLIGYNSKTGQEDLFIGVMAPWTAEGSSMEWTGEDGERWRYYIENSRMYTQAATITWSDAEKYTYRHIFIDPSESLTRVPSRFMELQIDPANHEETEKNLAVAQQWLDKAQAYYEDLRAKAKEQEEATA